MSDDRNSGLYGKYEVRRVDGSSGPGQKHAECIYFVLDLHHDPFATPALRAYAKSCRKEYPNLAADLDLLLIPREAALKQKRANDRGAKRRGKGRK